MCKTKKKYYRPNFLNVRTIHILILLINQGRYIIKIYLNLAYTLFFLVLVLTLKASIITLKKKNIIKKEKKEPKEEIAFQKK